MTWSVRRRRYIAGILVLAAGLLIALVFGMTSSPQAAQAAPDPDFAVLNTTQVAARDIPARIPPTIVSFTTDTSGWRLAWQSPDARLYLVPGLNGNQELLCRVLVLHEGQKDETWASGCAERNFVVSHGTALVYQERSEPRWVVAVLPDGYDQLAAAGGTIAVGDNVAVFRSSQGEASLTATGANRPPLVVPVD